MNHGRNHRVRARRALVVRLGLATIGAASLVACIFDQGNGYQGGGRIDHGATVGSGSSSSSSSSTGSPSSSSSSSSSASSTADVDAAAMTPDAATTVPSPLDDAG